MVGGGGDGFSYHS